MTSKRGKSLRLDAGTPTKKLKVRAYSSAKKSPNLPNLPPILRDPAMSYEGQLGGTMDAAANKYLASFRNKQHNMSYQVNASNFELAAYNAGVSPGKEMSFKDVIQKNIGDLKSFKAGKM